MTYVFTYGTEGQPFCGGWTEVEAPNKKAAVELFRIYHPDKTEGIVNCSCVYTEEEFAKTSMAGESGNFGKYCHEKIKVMRTEGVFDK